MQRRKVFAANWKMNHGIEDAIKFITGFTRQALPTDQTDIVICPPFTSLYTVGIALQDSEIKLGAQNCHFEDNGAFTGEVSAVFLKEVGCQYVIIGHSERRHVFNEIDHDIAKKVSKALEHDLTPIFCVGETDAERKAEKTFAVLDQQIRGGLAHLERTQLERIIIAYEPVWAIGTGNTATPTQAQEAHAFIRTQIGKLFGISYGNAMRILYGGSIKSDNIRSLMAEPDIDGGLVGGASLKADSFLEIVQNGSGHV
jgi:triosephosphate isomerase